MNDKKRTEYAIKPSSLAVGSKDISRLAGKGSGPYYQTGNELEEIASGRGS